MGLEEVRDYSAWYRHIILAILAHAYLLATGATRGKGASSILLRRFP